MNEQTVTAGELNWVKTTLHRLRRRRRIMHYWLPVLCWVAIMALILHFILGIYMVSGVSMEPNLLAGDLVLCQKNGAPPKNDDLVVLQEPSGTLVVKRVAGVGGDVINVSEDGHLTRNGKSIWEPNVWYGDQDTDSWVHFPLTVPQDSLFYLGDNRPMSLDSRQSSIGCVPVYEIQGRVIFVLRRTGQGRPVTAPK